MRIFNKIKSMAKKMRPKSLDEYDEEVFKGKIPRNMSIYHKGERDFDTRPGHGRYKNQGLSNYIKFMEDAEKQGKFKFDTRHVKPT